MLDAIPAPDPIDKEQCKQVEGHTKMKVLTLLFPSDPKEPPSKYFPVALLIIA